MENNGIIEALGYIGVIVVFAVLVSLPFLFYGTIAYVLVHFIKKVW